MKSHIGYLTMNHNKLNIAIRLKHNGILLINGVMKTIASRKLYRFNIDLESITNIVVLCPFNEELMNIINDYNNLTQIEVSNLIQDELLNLNYESFATAIAFMEFKDQEVIYRIIGPDIDIYIDDNLLLRNDELYFGIKDASGSSIYKSSRERHIYIY